MLSVRFLPVLLAAQMLVACTPNTIGTPASGQSGGTSSTPAGTTASVIVPEQLTPTVGRKFTYVEKTTVASGIFSTRTLDVEILTVKPSAFVAKRTVTLDATPPATTPSIEWTFGADSTFVMDGQDAIWKVDATMDKASTEAIITLGESTVKARKYTESQGTTSVTIWYVKPFVVKGEYIRAGTTRTIDLTKLN